MCGAKVGQTNMENLLQKQPPKKGSDQWKKNETIINNNGKLKRLRDRSQGLEKAPHRYSNAAGKGSAPRTDINSEEWKQAYDQIDWSTNRNTKKSYRVKINGKYQDE